MTLTGEKCSAGTTATMFTTNSTWNSLGSNPDLRGDAAQHAGDAPYFGTTVQLLRCL